MSDEQKSAPATSEAMCGEETMTGPCRLPRGHNGSGEEPIPERDDAPISRPPEPWWPEEVKAAWGKQCEECQLWNGWHNEGCSKPKHPRYTSPDPRTNDAPQHTCTGAGAVSCKACDANVAATGHRFVPAGWHDRVGYVLAEDRVGLLDDVCRWLFEAGFKDAADRLLEDRNKFICADPIQQPEQRTQEATPHELTVTAYGKTWTESQVRALLDENERLRDDANVTCGHERLIKQAKDVVRAWEDDPTSTVTENEIRELGLRADSAVDAAHRSDNPPRHCASCTCGGAHGA